MDMRGGWGGLVKGPPADGRGGWGGAVHGVFFKVYIEPCPSLPNNPCPLLTPCKIGGGVPNRGERAAGWPPAS